MLNIHWVNSFYFSVACSLSISPYPLLNANVPLWIGEIVTLLFVERRPETAKFSDFLHQVLRRGSLDALSSFFSTSSVFLNFLLQIRARPPQKLSWDWHSENTGRSKGREGQGPGEVSSLTLLITNLPLFPVSYTRM